MRSSSPGKYHPKHELIILPLLLPLFLNSRQVLSLHTSHAALQILLSFLDHHSHSVDFSLGRDQLHLLVLCKFLLDALDCFIDVYVLDSFVFALFGH